MGMEIEINSLKEMCDLMCNNKLPKRRDKKPKTGKKRGAPDNSGNAQHHVNNIIPDDQ